MRLAFSITLRQYVFASLFSLVCQVLRNSLNGRVFNHTLPEIFPSSNHRPRTTNCLVKQVSSHLHGAIARKVIITCNISSSDPNTGSLLSGRLLPYSRPFLFSSWLTPSTCRNYLHEASVALRWVCECGSCWSGVSYSAIGVNFTTLAYLVVSVDNYPTQGQKLAGSSSSVNMTNPLNKSLSPALKIYSRE